MRMAQAFVLEKRVTPRRAAALTSRIEIADVRAATKSREKNAIATRFPYGITMNAFGSVTNASSAPIDGDRPEEKTMGKITRPASMDAVMSKTMMIIAANNIPCIRLAANLGIGGAVQTGFKYAVNNHYDIVVQVDGDGQHDPAWVSTLIYPIIQGEVDCVIGSRYMKENPDKSYRTPFFRRIGMFFSSTLLFLATGVFITDTTSGFRALTYPVFEYFAKEYPVDHPEAESLLMLHRAGFNFREVPVKMKERLAGDSLFTFINSILYPFRVLVGFAGILLRNRERNK
jgi:GT2 family glycosyltransferase